MGLPAIAVFPSTSGYRYYYWGGSRPNQLAFRSPPDQTSMRPLAELITLLSGTLLAESRRDFRPSSEAGEWVDTMIKTCRQIHQRFIPRATGLRTVKDLMDRLRSAIPNQWHQFMLAELKQLIEEIGVPDERMSDKRMYDKIVRDRLANVYAAKAIKYYSWNRQPNYRRLNRLS
jgi:hypothetical protein